MPDYDHKERSRESFDKVAHKYEMHYMGRHSKKLHPRVVQHVRSVPHNSILDVGCGTGNLLVDLSVLGAETAGSDISPEMIKHAQKRLGARAEPNVADSENLPWSDSSFEVIVSTDSFHHYPNPEAVLQERYRVLTKKGYLIIADPLYPEFFRKMLNFSFKFSRQGDVKVYSREEWESMLKNTGLKLLECDNTIPGSVVLIAQSE